MASAPRSSMPADESRARKGYHSPKLHVYGDIRAITQTIVNPNTKNLDGAAMPPNKTG